MSDLDFRITKHGPQIDLKVAANVSRDRTRVIGIDAVALIDTGSGMSVVSTGLLKRIHAQRIGTELINRPGVPMTLEATYLVGLGFVGQKGRTRWFSLEAVAIEPSTPGVQVILGMELLMKVDMHWYGPRGIGNIVIP